MMEEMEAKWQHKCTALESLVDEANHHLGQSRTEYAALTARLEAVTLRHAEELKRQQETHAVTLQKAQTTQRQLTTDMEHLRAQQAGVEALRAQIVDLERGLAAAQEEAETTRAERGRVVAGLEGTILQLKRDVGRAEAEGLAHQHAARDTHEQVEGLKNELAGMARKYEAAVAKRAEDQATLGEATAKAQSEALGLEQRLLSKERTVADLRDTLTRVQNEGIVREKVRREGKGGKGGGDTRDRYHGSWVVIYHRYIYRRDRPRHIDIDADRYTHACTPRMYLYLYLYLYLYMRPNRIVPA